MQQMGRLIHLLLLWYEGYLLWSELCWIISLSENSWGSLFLKNMANISWSLIRNIKKLKICFKKMQFSIHLSGDFSQLFVILSPFLLVYSVCRCIYLYWWHFLGRPSGVVFLSGSDIFSVLMWLHFLRNIIIIWVILFSWYFQYIFGMYFFEEKEQIRKSNFCFWWSLSGTWTIIIVSFFISLCSNGMGMISLKNT